ncbi:hypothetical protein VI817_000295 [Penicillium citrinum]|nr:hypothetical protein VI817_000295 [Penicillium citrinum]
MVIFPSLWLVLASILTKTGGHVKPDIYNFIAKLAADYGGDAAAEVAAFEAKHVYAFKDFVAKENIDCDYTVTRAIDVQLNRAHYEKTKAGFQRLIAGGCAATKQAHFIDAGDAEKFSGVKGAVGYFSYASGHIWAYKFVLHLLDKLVSQGVNLQTHTPVLKITKTNTSESKYSWRVHTDRGAIHTGTVVLATNAYTSSLLPQYQGKIVPVRGTCSRIIVPPGFHVPELTKTYTLRWSEWDYDYLIPRRDGSIIVGGARSAFIQDIHSWYNVSDDSRVLESATDYFKGYMQRNFDGWEDSHAYTDRVWTGIMGYSSDGLPHIGTVPGQDDLFILAGFTGHGMPQIFLAAEGVAKMIMDGVPYEETELPRLFKTTQARLSDPKSNILEKMPNSSSSEAKL